MCSTHKVQLRVYQYVCQLMARHCWQRDNSLPNKLSTYTRGWYSNSIAQLFELNHSHSIPTISTWRTHWITLTPRICLMIIALCNRTLPISFVGHVTLVAINDVTEWRLYCIFHNHYSAFHLGPVDCVLIVFNTKMSWSGSGLSFRIDVSTQWGN